MASTAMSTSPWPVIMITSTLGMDSRVRMSRLRSFTSGSHKSVITTSNQ